MIAWVYGSGFPKSRNLKGEWQGWGTALKPALEPITIARKPLGEKTVAANVLAHGTGAINVDGCRVAGWKPQVTQGINSNASSFNIAKERRISGDSNEGRWPANLIHDGSDEVLGLFPVTKSGTGAIRKNAKGLFGLGGDGVANVEYGDTGSAARFFYCAKTSKQDRNDGCDGLPDKEWAADGACIPERDNRPFNPSKNNHPTVKPTSLMRYLCRLVTPPDGVVLDPFMGSGSTGKAAVIEGFNFIGIEREESYMEIAEARINPAKTPA
jgi:site-specific DNA-methyltransferase (adenine-specific)